MSELQKAIQTGKEALAAAAKVGIELAEAKRWSDCDLIGFGMAGIQKHKHMDQAQAAAEELRLLIDRFQGALQGICAEITMDIHLQTSEFLRGADHIPVFDIFIDVTMAERIRAAQEQLETIYDQIKQMIEWLEEMKEETHV